MMTQEQVKTVVLVYSHLLDKEKRGWDGLDDYIEYLEYLDDQQLCVESDVLYGRHVTENVRCTEEHDIQSCFIPLLVESVGAILDLYKETKLLHIKNKYILHYYLAMNQAGMIVVDRASSAV